MTSLNILLLVLGISLLIAAIFDLLWTTLWSDRGAGPLSSPLMAGAWNGLKTVGGPRSRLLSVAGPIILMLTLLMWVSLLWSGWTLVFAGGENALIDTRDSSPLRWTEYIYFVAYSLFTMGNGDFSPADGVWQIVTSLTTASGMLFVTMAVSYVLSVLGAVVDKRSFATTVTGIGTRSEAFVRDGWDGEDFHQLDLPLDTLASDVSRLSKQHKAYPILHYYHSQDSEDSSARAIAIFDEALTLLRFSVPDEHQPNEPLLNTTRSSTLGYLQTLDAIFIRPADEVPPSPDVDCLRDAGIPTVPNAEFANSLDELSDRRQKLLGVVNADAWDWPRDDQ